MKTIKLIVKAQVEEAQLDQLKQSAADWMQSSKGAYGLQKLSHTLYVDKQLVQQDK